MRLRKLPVGTQLGLLAFVLLCLNLALNQKKQLFINESNDALSAARIEWLGPDGLSAKESLEHHHKADRKIIQLHIERDYQLTIYGLSEKTLMIVSFLCISAFGGWLNHRERSAKAQEAPLDTTPE